MLNILLTAFLLIISFPCSLSLYSKFFEYDLYVEIFDDENEALEFLQGYAMA